MYEIPMQDWTNVDKSEKNLQEDTLMTWPQNGHYVDVHDRMWAM